jgi:flagellar biosynthesis protein FlhG
MDSVPRIVCAVSGKGGVGKTVISANLARLVSFSRKVLLIDFDFPNQGLTGLFADEVQGLCYSARELILGPDTIDFEQISEIRPNLLFIPAFDSNDRDRFDLGLDRLNKSSLLEQLRAKLHSLIEVLGVDLIILDCHGGLDSISFASFVLSDRTIIVSEPDKITFNGTLELIDYYEENCATISSDAFGSNGEGAWGRVCANKALFLLNRVSGRFTYAGLMHLYKSEVGGTSGFAASIIKDYIFIPSDSMLAQSVSEYPLYIELAAESIYCQKLELVYWHLFNVQPYVPDRGLFYRIFERQNHRSLERRLTSMEEDRSRVVFSFITALQFFVLFAAIWLSMFGIDKSSQQTPNRFYEVVAALVLLGSSWLNLKISTRYRDVARFDIRLFRLGRRRIAMITLFQLIRAIAARIYLVVAAALFTILGIGLLVMAFGLTVS